MQFHCPSVVQAVPAAIAVPVPAVPVLAGLDDEAITEAAALDTGEARGAADDTTGALEDTTGTAEVALLDPADVVTVTNTPPSPPAAADDLLS